ncbi:MAG: hypothetical protein M1831_006978 [Alyxoria varia]|nr:MAG: hypothetical protein M1831_006978 [Alyxoria varia]
MARLNLEEDNTLTPPSPPPRPSIGPLQRSDSSRSTTEPSPIAPLPSRQESRSRNRSPYSRSHLRSQSAASIFTAPVMTRTRSAPLVHQQPLIFSSPSDSPARPSSPLRQAPPARSSPRRSLEESRPQNLVPSFMDIESIAEDSELDLTTRNTPVRDSQGSPAPPMAIHSNTFPRSSGSRRRPTSPLTGGSAPTSSPSWQPAKFNEPFPNTQHNSSGSFSLSAGSSMPSTPSSLRSRSPSISSLETIPDSPDAEEAATEAHHIARLKAAADAAEAAAQDTETEKKLRAAGLEVPGAKAGGALASSQSLKDKRKRWSVCGAERRGDFEMETIWED